MRCIPIQVAVAAFLACATTAAAADAPARLAAVSAYADTVDAILGDGLMSGDIAALRQATGNVAVQLDGLVPADATGPFVECGVELTAAMDYVKASLDALTEQKVEADAYQAEVAGLRALAENCLAIWRESR